MRTSGARSRSRRHTQDYIPAAHDLHKLGVQNFLTGILDPDALRTMQHSDLLQELAADQRG